MKGQELSLRYLDASRVASPAGDLGGMKIETDADRPLGHLEGILVDPRERRVRYLVVKSPGWFKRRKYLVSADCLAKVAPGARTLRLDVAPEDLEALEEFDQSGIRQFSEEDAIEAMFARVA